MLCVADEVDLMVYSQGVRERFPDIDLILSAGDLPDGYLEFVTSMLNKPILSVAGNHDSPGRGFRGGRPDESGDMFGYGPATGRFAFRIRREAGISVLGLPGCMRYNAGPNQYTDLGMTLRLLPLLPVLLARRLFTGRGVDVILAHAPPLGIHDGTDVCHRGFRAFTMLIRLAAPRWFVHGHVHLYDLQALRERECGRTTVVNVYGHRVLDLEPATRGLATLKPAGRGGAHE